MDYDEEFLNTFNEKYPFERYIFKEPMSIGTMFDDVMITEIFVPYTEIKPILDEVENFCGWTHINNDEVYIKCIGKAGEMRFAYYDFESHIRENIRNNMISDFGECEYENLYVDGEEENGVYSDLINVLNLQKKLIIEKYGECHIKPSVRSNLVE